MRGSKEMSQYNYARLQILWAINLKLSTIKNDNLNYLKELELKLKNKLQNNKR